MLPYAYFELGMAFPVMWDFPSGSDGKESACNTGRFNPWVQSLSLENPLKKGIATHSNSLAWRIPWTEEPGGLQSMGSQKVTHEWLSVLFPVTQPHLLLWFWRPKLWNRDNDEVEDSQMQTVKGYVWTLSLKLWRAIESFQVWEECEHRISWKVNPSDSTGGWTRWGD